MDDEDMVRTILGIFLTRDLADDTTHVEKWVNENLCQNCSNCKRKW
jgi:hypothetical protein